MNVKVIADWAAVRLKKQKDIDKNNVKENDLRINHDYQIGDKVLITNNDIDRKLNRPTKGPFHIIQVYTNGTTHVKNGAGTEQIIIRCCTPYTD